jgi:hypothetical protein
LLSDMISRTSDKKSKATILSGLYYPRTQDRRSWISEAYAKTLNWAWKAKPDVPLPVPT